MTLDPHRRHPSWVPSSFFRVLYGLKSSESSWFGHVAVNLWSLAVHSLMFEALQVVVDR